MTEWSLAVFIAGFGSGYLAHAAKAWLRQIGTPGPLPRGVGQNLSSF